MIAKILIKNPLLFLLCNNDFHLRAWGTCGLIIVLKNIQESAEEFVLFEVINCLFSTFCIHEQRAFNIIVFFNLRGN